MSRFEVSEERRDFLKTEVDRLTPQGDSKELVECLIELSYLAKHVGDGDESFVSSHKYGINAANMAHRLDEKELLGIALRYASVPFVGADCETMLKKSLEIFREIGNRKEEAWTIYRMTRAEGVEGYTVEMALEIFEDVNDEGGIAACLISLMPRTEENLDRAIAIYKKHGAERDLKMALMMKKCYFPNSLES